MNKQALIGLATVVFFVAVGYSMFQLYTGESTKQDQLTPGEAVPRFAAALAGSGNNADANIAQPGQSGVAKGRRACDVKLKGSINNCGSGRMAILFWFSRGGACEAAVDALSALDRRFPTVQKIAVAVGESQESATTIARTRGWKIPVALDPDNAVASIYQLIACPTLVTAKDGRVVAQVLGNLTSQRLTAELQRLIRM